MEDIIREVQERLERIDFEALWPGFKVYDFAVYNQEKVFMKDRVFSNDGSFFGNTCKNHDGQWIAIWHLEDPQAVHLDRLTAYLVHEMFHAHQKTMNDQRYYNDLEALKYPHDLKNYQVKQRELVVLKKAFESKNHKEKKTYFDLFQKCRNTRQSIVGDMLSYELALETFEGSAEYVTLQALKQLNHKAYELMLDEILKRLDIQDQFIFNTRRITYYSGAVLICLADQMGWAVKKPLDSNGVYIYDELPKVDGQVDQREDASLAPLFKDYVTGLRDKIDALISDTTYACITGPFQVQGYDPMNMVRDQNRILHKTALILEVDKHPLMIKGPVVAICQEKDYFTVLKYYARPEEDDH